MTTQTTQAAKSFSGLKYYGGEINVIWLIPLVTGMIDLGSWYMLKKMQWGNCIFWAIYYILNLALAIVFAIAY